MMAVSLEIGVFLRMPGPGQFANAQEKHEYVYPMNNQSEAAQAFGALDGIQKLVRDLKFEYRGAHYGVLTTVASTGLATTAAVAPTTTGTKSRKR